MVDVVQGRSVELRELFSSERSLLVELSVLLSDTLKKGESLCHFGDCSSFGGKVLKKILYGDVGSYAAAPFGGEKWYTS